MLSPPLVDKIMHNALILTAIATYKSDSVSFHTVVEAVNSNCISLYILQYLAKLREAMTSNWLKNNFLQLLQHSSEYLPTFKTCSGFGRFDSCCKI